MQAKRKSIWRRGKGRAITFAASAATLSLSHQVYSATPTPWITNEGTGTIRSESSDRYSGTVGAQVTFNSNVIVTHVGIWDNGGALAVAEDAGFFNLSGTLLGSATVPTTGHDVGTTFSYQSLANSLNFSTGTSVLLGAQMSHMPGGADVQEIPFRNNNNTAPTTTSAASITGARFAAPIAPTLQAPLNSAGSSMFLGPTFKYVNVLTWTGAANSTWNAASVNWDNGSVAHPGNVYQDTDAVSFGDYTYTGVGGTLVANTNVALSGTITPYSTVIKNTTATDYTLSGGTITGSGVFVKAGNGNATIGTTNTYTGATFVTGGVLTLDFTATDSSKFANGAALNLGGGTVNLSGGTHTEVVNSTNLNAGASGVIRSGGATGKLQMAGIARNVGSTLNLGAAGIATTNTNNFGGANGILGGAYTVAGTDWAASVNAGAANTDITALAGYTSDAWAAGNNTTVTASSSPASDSTTHSLRFNATGSTMTVTLAGTNTITTGGILVTPNVGAFGTVITGGTLRGSSGGADLVIQQFNTTESLSIASVIADNGSATALTKSGPGLLVLTNNNTYTGQTYLNAGTIRINGNDNLGAGAAGATLNMHGGTLQAVSTFALNNGGGNHRAVVLNDNGGTFDVTSGNTLSVTGVVSSVGPTLTSFTGQGVGVLSKTNSGTLVLSGSNTYTGGTRLDQGTLVAGSSSALGNVVSRLTLNAGTLDLRSDTSINPYITTVNGAVTINPNKASAASAGITHTLGPLQINGSTMTVAAGANVAANSAYGLTFAATSLTGNPTFAVSNNGLGAGTVTLGAITDVLTARTITKQGDGTLALSAAAASLVDGTAVNITAGTVSSNATGALGTLAVVTTSTGTTLNIGATQTIGAINSAVGNTGSLTIAGTNTVTIGSTNNLNSSFAGVISGGSGNLVKAGLGTFMLTGASTYGGTTDINAGSLHVTGSLANPGGLVSVNSTGTLKGSGSVNRSVTINSGGTISPGDNAVGTMTTGAQTWAGGGNYLWEINDATGTKGASPGWDFVSMTGALSVTATSGSKFNINISTMGVDALNFNKALDQSWIIATASSPVSISNATFNVDRSGFTNTAAGTFSVSGSGNDVLLNFTHSGNNTAITTPTTAISFGRVSQNIAHTQSVTLNKTGSDSTTYTITTGGDATSDSAGGSFAGGPQSTNFNGGISVAATGNRTGTITIHNAAADSADTGLGSDDPDAIINVSGTVLADRVINVTTPNLGGYLRNAGAGSVGVSGTANLSTSGDDDNFTRLTVGTNPGVIGGGVSVGVGSGSQLFNNAGDTATRDITGAINTVSSAYLSGSRSQPVTGEGLAGEVDQPVSVGFTATVGFATADNNNLRNQFGTPLVASVDVSGQYAGLQSKVDAVIGVGGTGTLNTVATIKAGINATGPAETVSMAWRTRNQPPNDTELDPGEPGLFFTTPAGLKSDVVRLTGMNHSPTQIDGGSVRTDPFALEMSYDGIADEEGLASAGFIFMVWLDPGANGVIDNGPGGDDKWVPATDGNFVTGSNVISNPSLYTNVQSSWEDFATLHGINAFTDLSPWVGAWGIDVNGGNDTADGGVHHQGVVWAILDHNSDFAVVPEPAGLALVGVGAAALLRPMRRKRPAKK